MKTLRLIPLLAMLFMLTVASTCSHDDHDDRHRGRDEDRSSINKTAVQGNWNVTRFEDSGSTKTADFAGYSFTFAADGSLQAKNENNSSNNFNGSWLTVNGDNGVDFGIVFPADFRELSGHWTIISCTATKIELIHDDTGNGVDLLTFEKN